MVLLSISRSVSILEIIYPPSNHHTCGDTAVQTASLGAAVCAKIWAIRRPSTRKARNCSPQQFSSAGNIGRWMSWRRPPPHCQLHHPTAIHKEKPALPQSTHTLWASLHDTQHQLKYLGLTISTNVKWNEHGDNICGSAQKMLVFLAESSEMQL